LKKRIHSAWDLDEDEFSESEGFYSKDYRSALLENDEISAWEAAFMEGWDDAIV